jgi:hypothetical protein
MSTTAIGFRSGVIGGEGLGRGMPGHIGMIYKFLGYPKNPSGGLVRFVLWLWKGRDAWH